MLKNKISTIKKLYRKLRENKDFSALKSIYLVFLQKINLTAFTKQAINYRKKLNIPIIAVTGTNGKTTTKELITAVLSKKYKVASTGGNYNNHIGVPLTILSIDKSIEIAVVEMGANHPNEIKSLCDIAKPTHGLITNIGIAHLEGFGNFETVKKTKNELYDFLKQNNGNVFFNKDNEILCELIGDYNKKISYGKENADYNACLGENNIFTTVNWNSSTKTGVAKSNLIGQYNLENILAAIAVANYFDVEASKIDEAIKNYFPDNKRSQYTKTEKNILIQDFYNANPSSMKVAIENFIKLEKKNKCLIIGDMLELGNAKNIEHKKIIELITQNNVENAFFIGNCFSELSSEYNGNFYTNIDDFVNYLKNTELKDKTILIKGSRGIHLEKCIEYL